MMIRKSLFERLLVLAVIVVFGLSLSSTAYAGPTSGLQCLPGLEKYVIILDTSGSVSSSEFTFFRAASDAMVNEVLDGSRNAQVAIVHYNTSGSGGAGTHGYDVVVPFTNVPANAIGWTRANYDSSSPLYNRIQDHLPGSLQSMRASNVWSTPSSGVYLDDADTVDIILYTDASIARQGDTEDTRPIGIPYPTGNTTTTNGTTNWGTINNPPQWRNLIGWRNVVTNDYPSNYPSYYRRGCCSSLLDLGRYYDNHNSVSPLSLPLYGEYNHLKDNYDATISIVAVDYSSTYPRHDIEKAAIAAIASVGGDWGDDPGEHIVPNPGDPEGSGVGPRRATFVQNFSDIPGPQEIIQRVRVNVGNSVSVATTNDRGDGSVVQGFSQPVLSNGTDNVFWTGELRAFFIDEWGNFREDNPTAGNQGQLDDPSIDRAFELVFDETDQIAKIQRLNLLFDTDNEFLGTSPDGGLVDATFLNAIWDAGDTLASYNQSNIKTQRDYSTAATSGSASRFIFTWHDIDADEVVDESDDEIIEFQWVGNGSATRNFVTKNNRFAILGNTSSYGTNSNQGANRLVQFTRGRENSNWGFRSRKLGSAKHLLGDIENSNPLQILPPSGNYDTEYGWNSYGAFKALYERRRRVVYAGANDGMLHAFNMGFWDSVGNTFSEAAPADYQSPVNATPAEHDLGAELWAYIPTNATKRLGSLTADSYTLDPDTNEPDQHFYFVDGATVSFDAQIFAPDATHPGGWGTILVAGTGYGGGGSDSRYIVMDVTDPEQEPKLMMEVTHPNLNMTTSRPDIVRYRNFGDVKWYLAFGSGPDSSVTHTSSTGATVFLYDLSYANGFDKAKTAADRTILAQPLVGRQTNGFVGDVAAVDWDTSNVFHNAVYFGSAEESFVTSGSSTNPVVTFTRNGDLRRLNLSNDTVSTVLATSPQVPILNKPLPYTDEVVTDAGLPTETREDFHWLTVGSGKTITRPDIVSTQQHYQFGVIEDVDAQGYPNTNTYGLGDLFNVTGVTVSTAGEVAGGAVAGTSITDVDELKEEIRDNHQGWYLQLDASDPLGSERTTTAAINYNEIIFFSTTVNASTVCSELVDTALYAADIATGLPFYQPGFTGVLGNDGDGTTDLDNDGIADGTLAGNVEFGSGIIREITLFGDRVIGPSDLGDIQNRQVDLPDPVVVTPPTPGPSQTGRKSWTEITF